MIFLSYQHSFSQHDKTIPDSLTYKSFQELYDLFYASKPDTLKATLYANSYYMKALKEKDPMEMAGGKYFLADIKDNDNIYLNFCDSLIEISKRKPTKHFPAAIHIDKGRFFFHKNKVSLMTKELLRADKFTSLFKNDSLDAIKNMYLGLAKSKIGHKKEALFFYLKSLEYIEQNDLTKINNHLLSLPLNISIMYKKLNKLDTAIYFNQKAASLYSSTNDSVSLAYTFYNAGSIFFIKINLKMQLLATKSPFQI